MRLFRSLPILIILFLLIISCGSSQKSVMTAVSSLRPRINEGDTIKYESKLISNSRMFINAFEYPELQYYGKAKIYTIVTKREGDSTSFKSGIIDASSSLRRTGYRLSSIHIKNSIHMDWDDLEGKEWEYTLTSSGLTKDSDEEIDQFLWLLFPFFPPEEPVTVGTSWERKIGKGFIINYRFLEMKGDNAIIEFKYKYKGTKEPDDSEIDEIIFEEETKAKVTLNTKTGKVMKIDIESDEKRTAKINQNRLKIYFDDDWDIKVIE